jgi:hypothetical protein
MLRFLKGLLGPRGGGAGTPSAEASVEYNGATITPAPEKVSGGWRLAGTISKDFGGSRRVHRLDRADTAPDRDAIVAMMIAKAKRLIDEQGDRLFPDA